MEVDLEQLWDSSKAEASEEGKENDMFYIRDRVAEKLDGKMEESTIKKYKPLFENIEDNEDDEWDEDDDSDEESEDDSTNEFYVAITKGSKEAIIRIKKSPSGKWTESTYKGDEIYGVGGKTYGSHLRKDNILEWLYKDFDSAEEISKEEADEF